MWALIKRELTLYFGDRHRMFWSLFSPLLVLGIYVVFLQHNLTQGWHGQTTILNQWLIGGLLATTALSTSLSALGVRVEDLDEGKTADFLLSGVKPVQVVSSYWISALIVSFVMSGVVLVINAVYFGITDETAFAWQNLGDIISLIGLNVFAAVGFNAVLVELMPTRNGLQGLGSAVGSLAGFLVGTYIPISAAPDFAQLIMKIFPGFHGASLLRQALITQPVSASTSQDLGITIAIQNHLLSNWISCVYMIGVGVMGVIIALLLSKKRS